MQDILQQVQVQNLNPKKAYRRLYQSKRKRRAWFLYFTIIIKKKSFINLLLRIIFLLPLPIFISKLIIKLIIKRNKLSNFSLKNVKITKGHLLRINNDEVKISIYAF